MHRPPRLNYFTGNRLELLADRLAETLATDPLPPRLREVVIVPSRGMGSWLERELALRLGIAASLDLPFPDRFVEDLAARFGLGRPAPEDPFRPAAMLWELHELFWQIQEGRTEPDDDGSLVRYLESDPDGRKRFQLARRMARLYSQYQVARPRGIVEWERGGAFGDALLEAAGERWQRALWRRLAAGHPQESPPARRILDLVRRIGRGDFEEEWLPERVSVFGASTMPRMLTEALAALSAHRPVDLYLLVPTPGYLGDLENRAMRERRPAAFVPSPAEEFVGELGQVGRDFFRTLLDLDPRGGAFGEAGFVDPGSGTALRHLQSALYRIGGDELPDPGEEGGDASLRLHSCHSPLREMEVLRDEVFQALADGAADTVADVLVLVPDIRRYAPFARSVFGAAVEHGDGSLRLPLRIADRATLAEAPFARIVLQLLELAASRLAPAELFALLHEAPVRARYDLTDEDVDALRERLVDAGAIWGADPDDRATQSGGPRFSGVSWREAIDRVLLGNFTGPVETMIDGVLPAADATVSDADTFARMATALDDLFGILPRLRDPATLAEWMARLREAVLRLTDAAGEGDAEARARCLEILDRVENDAAGSPAPVGRLALRDLLETEFADLHGGAGFVSGVVTVAELRPMRSLPAQVVVVAGLDAESFPRRDPADGIDLVAADRRPGDRSPRDDDLQLFLELVLSARNRLVLSYVGRSERDDHERTVSPCVQELLDTMRALGLADPTVQHPLQPFTSKHSGYGTYDHAMVRAAQGLAAPGGVAAFVDASVTEPATAVGRSIALDDLCRFWSGPSAWFCTRGLGLALHRDREEADAEALGLDGLKLWAIRDLELREPGLLRDPERLRARSGLPDHGLVALEVAAIAGEFATVRAALGFDHADLEPRAVEVPVGGIVVEGEIEVGPDAALAQFFAGRTDRPRRRIEALVRHVVACAAGQEARSLVVPVVDPAGVSGLEPVAGAAAILERLVRGFVEGHHRPVSFYPETSLNFGALLAGTPGADPLELFRHPSVQKTWAQPPGDDQQFGKGGECHDEAVALCVRGRDEAEICDEEFVELARLFHAWLFAVEGKS